MVDIELQEKSMMEQTDSNERSQESIDMELAVDNERTDDDEEEKESIKYDHFFVLVHGNNGSPDHMQIINDKLKDTYERNNLSIISLVSSCNTGSTWEGVEQGGSNLAQEILNFISNHHLDYDIPFTMISHSLGGLYARTAIGILFSGLIQKQILNIKPTSFITVNTPHLGSLKPSITWQSSVKRTIGNAYLSIIKKTGKDLSFRDVVLQKVASYAKKKKKKKDKKKLKIQKNTNPDSPLVIPKEIQDKMNRLEAENKRLREHIRKSNGKIPDITECELRMESNCAPIKDVDTPSSTVTTDSDDTDTPDLKDEGMTVTEKLPSSLQDEMNMN
eukprot:CAMPEP_0117420842 /NCGR_PEP_ID=MMETSP0758-20121206/2094_1 /TAXON_ID=63605 /ORGANISM="Percolomonas cosmopolitus, Strain AE-1 (ATCC 50343)" /LENGTH=331 /DNA_ID=CAMNT_0005202691 /DNA_START=72 /DNA_END=1068 /DNA_ORIENTATION=-